MRGVAAVILGGAVLLAMTPAWAQGETAPFHGRVQEAPSPVAPMPVVPARPMPPSIGTFLGVPIRVWAPVAPPYNQLANRNGAASPLLPTAPPWWGEPSTRPE